MRTNKHISHIAATVLFLTGMGAAESSGQDVTKRLQLDSTVTESSDGSRLVEYKLLSFDFGPIAHPAASERLPLSYTEEAKMAYEETRRSEHEASLAERRRVPKRIAHVNLNDYAVGEIPLQEGMTPTGARTYQIPIPTAPGLKFTPSVAIGYNSQGAEGWAGYGWDIQGLSSISLISKNKYYHGTANGANANNVNAVFALDGNPLVTNTQPETNTEFPLITASGNILVSPNYNSQGYALSFTAKYPDGMTAQYGIGTDVSYNMPSYPVMEMTDLEGNTITFHYTSNISTGINRLTAVRYGYNNPGQPLGEITFTYTSNPEYATRYYAGKSIYRDYRLTGVVSENYGYSDNNESILCQYSFDYEREDNVWLLTQVDCSSGGESLRPLVFEYGASENYQPPANCLYQNHSQFLTSAFTSEDVDFVYRRGKFVSGSFNDGLLIYPLFSNYEATEGYQAPFWGHKYYKYGSLYADDQVILFAPSLSDFNDVDDSITTGSGFQTIEAVDVDGDGLDELVKVNFNGISGNNTKLLITIYKCNSLGVPVQSDQFEVQVQGTITSGDYVSPYRRAYFWGDFRGNGKIQLLTVAYDKNYNSYKNYDQTSYASLIDISTHSKLCEAELFAFPLDKYGCLLPYDLDNDSQTELCYATSSGLNVYRFGTSSFTHERTVSGLNAAILSNSDRPYHVTDLNGDGYIDIMYAPAVGNNTSWGRYAYNGDSFVYSPIVLTSRTEDDALFFIDVNQDGFSDLVKISGTTLGSYMNQNGSSFGSFLPSPSTISDAKGIVPGNIVDYSGMSCFVKVDGFYAYEYKYTALSPTLRQLTKSVDSMGRTLVNSYEYLPSSSRYWTDNSISVNNANGYAFRTLPIYVLEGEDAYLSEDPYAGRYRCKYYNYFNGVIHNWGLGFCGFSKIRSYDNTDSVTEIVEEIHDTQKRGVTTSVTTRHSSVLNDAFSTVTNTYDNNTTTYGKLNPRLTQSVTTDSVTGIETTTTFTYGSYDLPTSILTSRRIGTGTAMTEELVRVYENNVSDTTYILGVVAQESLIREGDGSTTLAWKEKTVNTYDNYYRPLSSKRYVGRFGRVINGPIFPIEPELDTLVLRANPNVAIDTTLIPIPDIEFYDATNLVSERRWQYDNYGNVISDKTAPYGATEFTGSTYTYNSDGQYLLTETDALGHTTTYSGCNKFGKPATARDYRNRITSYTYDAWGNLTTVTRPDSAVEGTSLGWGGSGLYTVTKTVTGRPETVVHYDALGRVVKSGVKRFNGQWQWTDKEYDGKGRLSRTSLPHRSDTTSYWNTYAYDAYNRPVSYTEASGKTSTWSYSGTSVTTVKDGITSTSTTDANGNVVSVTDAGGTITYALRDDGQPSKITAPGNVKTTFSYDDYGRRTKIVDPSAGTQTDAYVWNSDGSSEFAHTNPNGSVKTYRDKYGRTTLVERPGEYNTTYTYNNYGLLATELSTNGTGMEYTYDGLDRVVTTKENAPDGKWLRKVYNYGACSILNSVQYISPSGPITTETYTYANGHNTGITLPGGTVVWSLTSENDLGMPTSVTSGTVTREYGYTAFGLPTYRRMNPGDVQDFLYQFDVNTGNLLVRTDGANGQVETFGYDSLNRLTSIGSRQITYADNGNILSMDGVGTMAYGSTAKPYRITALTPESDGLVPNRQQTVSYTCYNRPYVLTEGGRTATFTYNGDGDRVKMAIADSTGSVLTRYYIGRRYEFDQTPNGSKERLYLGGDAYSAPMVYCRENSGSWTAYNIGRDYLGSITQIASLDGTLLEEYGYDPWGRLRDPQTLEIYTPGTEPELFLGRGFTGHEHLSWFGLINMNARLYDPLLGRFLSPDPYVQAPDFSQNFNRYSYALNNPLKYTDQSGEFIGTILTAILRLPIAIAKGIIAPFFVGFSDTKKAGNISQQAWKEYGQRVSNAYTIDMGLFQTDSDLSFIENAFSILSRFTWEAPQTILGNAFGHVRNNLFRTNVEYYHGATLVNRNDAAKNGWGATLGSYINGLNLEADPVNDYTFAHEYGHTKQSKILGPLYTPVVVVPSLVGAFGDYVLYLNDHDREWYEVWANQLSYNYFKNHGTTNVTANWPSYYPRTQHVDWYFYPTLAYYSGLVIAAVLIIL